VLILEMGMNHKGEIARLSRLCTPNLAIITNIGHAHIGNLGSREAIAEAKKEILLGAKEYASVLVPADEPLLADVQGRKTVGLHGEDADYAVYENADTAGYVLRKKDGDQVHLLHETKDEGLLSAMAFAHAAAMEMKISSTQISHANIDFNTNIFRQKEFLLDKIKIIFDAYNASFESVICAIRTHLSTPASTRALLLGDMLELGDFTEELHERIGYACAAARDGIHQLYLFGAQAETIADAAIRKGFAEKNIFINTNDERPDITAEQILRNTRDGTCLWIKGARGMRMERILDILTKNIGR
jgi:UDP-N-acetylmuramoyl-tripeptide--D-alanyl-D-alanine ligase